MKMSTFSAAAALAACMLISPAAIQAQRPGGAQTTPSQAPGSQPGGMNNPTMQQQQQQQMGANQGTQTDSGSNKMMKSSDARFAMKAAQGGMAEVQLGQLAAQKASNPDVKAFGQQMVDDHTKANDQLKSVAGQENMSLPTTLDAKDQALMTKLQNASGSDFDRMYVKAMVKDHQEDVKEFQKEADKGKDQNIKNFASQTLPVLQQHLSKIQGIQAGMGGGKASAGNAPNTDAKMTGGQAGGSGTGSTTGPQSGAGGSGNGQSTPPQH
jgi:putative membrane protein